MHFKSEHITSRDCVLHLKRGAAAGGPAAAKREDVLMVRIVLFSGGGFSGVPRHS